MSIVIRVVHICIITAFSVVPIKVLMCRSCFISLKKISICQRLLKPGINIYLDLNGYIDPYLKALPAGYGYKPERDYLNPLAALELTLNKNYTQNPGW